MTMYQDGNPSTLIHVFGATAAGKSTLVHVLSGLLPWFVVIHRDDFEDAEPGQVKFIAAMRSSEATIVETWNRDPLGLPGQKLRRDRPGYIKVGVTASAEVRAARIALRPPLPRRWQRWTLGEPDLSSATYVVDTTYGLPRTRVALIAVRARMSHS